jgi:hypothetical protein
VSTVNRRPHAYISFGGMWLTLEVAAFGASGGL